MAVAFGSIQTASDNSGTTLEITKPTGLAAGDLLIAILGLDGDTAFAATGWTQINHNDAGDQSMSILAKVADSSDASAVNFSFDATVANTDEEMIGALIRITGSAFSGAANIVDLSTTATATTTPSYATGITPHGTNNLLIMGALAYGANTVTASTYAIANNNPTWTEQADFSINQTLDLSLSVATATYSAATITGAYSLTLSASVQSIGYILAIAENTNVAVTGATGALTLTGNSGSATAGAAVAGATGTLTLSGNGGTLADVATDWTNTDKSSTSWTNPDKT